MKDKSLPIIGILLITSIGNYFRIIDKGNFRTVEFISVIAIGVLLGLFLGKLFLKNKN